MAMVRSLPYETKREIDEIAAFYILKGEKNAEN